MPSTMESHSEEVIQRDQIVYLERQHKYYVKMRDKLELEGKYCLSMMNAYEVTAIECLAKISEAKRKLTELSLCV